MKKGHLHINCLIRATLICLLPSVVVLVTRSTEIELKSRFKSIK